PLLGFLGCRPSWTCSPNRVRDFSYIGGQTIAFEYRSAEGGYDRLPALPADLVRAQVAVIITQGTPAAFAAKQATITGITATPSSGAEPAHVPHHRSDASRHIRHDRYPENRVLQPVSDARSGRDRRERRAARGARVRGRRCPRGGARDRQH